MPMNFNEVLDTKVQGIERPPLVPIGPYKAVVKKIPSIESSNDGKWDFLDFNCQLIEASEEVDQDDLKKFGGLKNTYMRHRFLFNKLDDIAFKRTEYNLRRFLEDHLKIEMNGETSLKEALNDSVNRQFMVLIRHRQDQNDAEVFYSEIGKTTPLV